MKKLSLSILLVSVMSISGLAGCASTMNSNPGYNSRSGTTTTIILTRHGDRNTLSSVLNDKGLARAQALAEVVGDYKITAIYCPDIKRNISTAEPAAKHFGIKIKTVGEEPDVDDVLKTMLSEHSGEVVLWVGNTNNLPQIYYELGGKGEPPISYGDLFIMEIKDKGYPEVIKKLYGPG